MTTCTARKETTCNAKKETTCNARKETACTVKKGSAYIIFICATVFFAVVLCSAMCACQTASKSNKAATAATNGGASVTETGEGVAELGFNPADIKDVSIKVYKQERRLDLLSGEDVVAGYSIALGWNPEGHKLREGDGKTPEGEYYVCTRNDKSKYYLSLGLSYPNIDDAKTGLDAGAITQDQFYNIEASIDGQNKPPWDTALGGEIMIHGHGKDRDWTAGCIAVENEVMDILWACCKLKTPVTIYP
jgi:L,D-peptidoglycan transpeptidase YkuD (ErfK/YbiS/YcfS/YnhG family)